MLDPRRRQFITLLGGAAAWPLVARGQQPGKPVVGFLNSASPDGYVPMVAAFHQGLKEAGYVDGQNATIEYLWAENHYDRLPALSSTARSACEARQTLTAGRRLAARFRTIQVSPKDLRTLPGHPEPAVSWHSGFRGGAHARPKTTPVHHAAWRCGRRVAARGARAAGCDAGDGLSQCRFA